MINLYHRKHEIAIDLSEISNPRAINIRYSGKMQAESMLPDDWFLMSNDKQIICVSLSTNGNNPELLMQYSGLIEIKGATVFDQESTKHNTIINVEDIDYWESMTAGFDQSTQYWESLGSVHKHEPELIKTSIVKNNLHTNSNEFFLEDGTPYEGDYHQHSDGQAMTESEHSEESEFIYRRDEKGKLQDMRKGLSSREKLQLESMIKIDIPKTRKLTKTDIQKIKESKKIYGSDKTKAVKTDLDRTSGTGGASGGGYSG